MVYGQIKFDKNHETSKLSKATGVPRDTIRLNERLDILQNISQPYEWNNYKFYGVENIEIIKKVKILQEYSFSLKEIKLFLDPIDHLGTEACKIKKDMFYNKLDGIDEKIKNLKKTKKALSQIMKQPGLIQ